MPDPTQAAAHVADLMITLLEREALALATAELGGTVVADDLGAIAAARAGLSHQLARMAHDFGEQGSGGEAALHLAQRMHDLSAATQVHTAVVRAALVRLAGGGWAQPPASPPPSYFSSR